MAQSWSAIRGVGGAVDAAAAAGPTDAEPVADLLGVQQGDRLTPEKACPRRDLNPRPPD